MKLLNNSITRIITFSLIIGLILAFLFTIKVLLLQFLGVELLIVVAILCILSFFTIFGPIILAVIAIGGAILGFFLNYRNNRFGFYAKNKTIERCLFGIKSKRMNNIHFYVNKKHLFRSNIII
jgi:hypothetical protein